MKHLFLCAGAPHPISQKPVYMLTCPDGDYVLEKIVRSCDVSSKDLIFAIREEDEAVYDVTRSFKELFGADITCVRISEVLRTGPLETVVQTINSLSLNGPLLIRDSDSYFSTPLPKDRGNYLAFADLDDCPHVSARALSFLKINDQGLVLDIQERHAISNLFAAGAYAFEEASHIPSIYMRLREHSPQRLYVSECIKECIFHRRDTFTALPVKDFVDWGEARGWKDWSGPQKTYFIDLDGVLCSNGGRNFKPRQLEAVPIVENIAVLRKLVSRGGQIIITTSRKEVFRKETEQQLKKWEVPYTTLVMGCLHNQRILVNDFSKTNPYPSAVAINVPRNSLDLKKILGQN